jgi:collagenase-like PrtC family protease
MKALDLGLTLGPLLFFWPRERVMDFYESAADWPVDTIYLGETVCGRRQQLRSRDWIALAQKLGAAGKRCILSAQALIESESDLKRLRALIDNGEAGIEANDLGAAKLAHDRGLPFVAGTTLNIYNSETLGLFKRLGAWRWVPPVEMDQDTVREILQQGVELECELFAWGKLPLAFSSRCFTARHYNLSKDSCEFRCLDHADGLTLTTRDGQDFLTINGIQTMSAASQSLLPHLEQIARIGVKAVRISPQLADMPAIVQAFADVIAGATLTPERLQALQLSSGGTLVDGYWRGQAGIVTLGASAHAHS